MSLLLSFFKLIIGWIIVLLLSMKDGVFCLKLTEVSNSLELCFASGWHSFECILETAVVVLTELRSLETKLFWAKRS
jgi:hypothetical protein